MFIFFISLSIHVISLLGLDIPVLFAMMSSFSSVSLNVTAGGIVENRCFIKPTSDNLDIGWKWNSYKDSSRKTIICDFCFHPSSRGITRAKKHRLRSYDKKKAVVNAFMSEVINMNEVDESGMDEIFNTQAGKRPATAVAKKKSSNVKGLMDAHLLENPEVSLKKTQSMAKQTPIKDSGDNKARVLAKSKKR
ncbi:unnamed protein product [Trifolium pratense]|uniref:Uncharacterized protein n=1 Tax=Trifolium pratense TaxID=57577 RepID=A0ACB0JKE3_TRIPR|nr:unnamed protein product [Trifolium pratense]